MYQVCLLTYAIPSQQLGLLRFEIAHLEFELKSPVDIVYDCSL